MKKLVVLAAFALLVATSGAYAQDKPAQEKAAKPAAAPTKTAVGTVKTLAADSVTVTDAKGKDWTFAVDAKTVVTAKGGSTKTAAAKSAGKAGILITDAVKVGDRVTVKYHEEGMHAASVRVM